MTHGLNERTIIRLALISEGVVAAAAVTWSFLRGIQIPWEFPARAAVIGVAAVAPLVVFNFVLFRLSKIEREPWKQLERFRNGVILPLCRSITPGGAAVIGGVSGFAEEYLFRGVITPECTAMLGGILGISAGSLIFSYVHFIGSAREFWLLVLVYGVVGAYLSAVYAAAGSIWAPILTHGIYNFCAIIYFRSQAIRMSVPE